MLVGAAICSCGLAICRDWATVGELFKGNNRRYFDTCTVAAVHNLFHLTRVTFVVAQIGSSIGRVPILRVVTDLLEDRPLHLLQ